MKGIDIYEGDNIQDWNVVKQQGIEVVIQKATQSVSHVDSLLKTRYPLMKNAGLKIGFYHFAQYNSTGPVSEAQHFLEAINGLESDTVLWLDLEAEEKWDKQTAINYANAFIDYIQKQGLKVGLYTGDSFYHDYLEGNIPNIPLWLASYGKQPDLYPENASWQYSESGSIDGIEGNVDLDYFIDNIFIKKEEKRKVKDIVCINNSVDERAGKYLSDYLQCPIIDNSLVKFDYTVIENVYGVGGGDFSSYTKKIIKGEDRFDTCQAVLNFIKNKDDLKQ